MPDVGRVAIATIVASLLAAGIAAAELSDRTKAQIAAVYNEKTARTPAQQKIHTKLLYAVYAAKGSKRLDAMPAMRQSVFEKSGLVSVDIQAKVSDALLQRIESLGGTVVSHYTQYDAIRARLPLTALEALAADKAVRTIRPEERAMRNMINVSEGVQAHAADTARTQFGVDGTGIDIGVLSDSVDFLADVQASGDLPAVTIIPGQSGVPASGEGTAMLEIVHDVAPGAGLFFATAFGGEPAFATNIVRLRNAGCQVIVDDIFYFFEPVYQDGIIAQAVDLVEGTGVSYFSSAGNSGNLNDGTSGVFEGDFVAGPVEVIESFTYTVHAFAPGVTEITITQDPPALIVLQWSDPFGGSGNDYDLFLVNGAGDVLDSSVDAQAGTGDPLEFIDSGPFNDAGLRLVIGQFAGAARRLHLNTNRGRLDLGTAGQTSGHAAAEGAFGVAAVDADDAAGAGGVFDGSESVETFSSDGPRRVFFEADGTPITPGNFLGTGGELRQKPDIAAADGVSTATPGFDPFFGTSAAAPHAAALTALLIEQGTFTTPAEVRTAFENSALDIEAPGVDRDSGVGLLLATALLEAGCSFAIAPEDASIGSTGASGQTFAVTAPTGCDWTAVSNDPFITVTGGGSGTGNGTVTYSVAANSSVARSGTITVAGEAFIVNQDQGCSFAIAPTARHAAAGGVTGQTIAVTAPAGCTWTAISNDPFITVTGGENGSGNGTVTYNVLANAGLPRTGTITVAGETFVVNQVDGCAFNIVPTAANLPASGAVGATVAIDTQAGCDWTAVSNDPFITVTGGENGSGSGSVAYDVAPNTGPERTGTITIAGETYSVTQADGCTFAFAPASLSVPAGGGENIVVDLITESGCTWTITADVPFVGFAKLSGSGPDTIVVSVEPNAALEPRSGVVMVGDAMLLIEQDAAQEPKPEPVPGPNRLLAALMLALAGMAVAWSRRLARGRTDA